MTGRSGRGGAGAGPVRGSHLVVRAQGLKCPAGLLDEVLFSGVVCYFMDILFCTIRFSAEDGDGSSKSGTPSPLVSRVFPARPGSASDLLRELREPSAGSRGSSEGRDLGLDQEEGVAGPAQLVKALDINISF